MRSSAFILSFILGMTLSLTASADEVRQKLLCKQHGTVAFVQYRNEADISVRFVASGEHARISFHRNRGLSPGMWRVVSKYENPDYLVYVDAYRRNDTVDVRIVDYNPGCSN